jgi:formate-dependent nitrite reductase membrane component NrfD
VQGFFEWLQSTPLAVAVGENWFPWVESTHVVFLAAVFGTIITVDTRLLGLASRHLRVTYLAEKMLPWTWLAFAGAALTGTLMFIANATTYSANKPFLIKMVLLVLAGLNMLYFQFVTYRSVKDWDTGTPTGAARAAGLISLVLWCGVIGFGRWIGFV